MQQKRRRTNLSEKSRESQDSHLCKVLSQYSGACCERRTFDRDRRKLRPVLLRAPERRRIHRLSGDGADEGKGLLLTGDFWRRGSEFLPFPRITRLTKRRARPFARLLPPPRRDLPARRRSSVTVSASVTPTSIMSLRALEFSYAALGCAEASSSVSSRVVQLKPPPRSWEY
jgi:hypothetical protein